MAPQHAICQGTMLPFYRSGEAPRWTDTLPSPLYGKVRPEHSVSLAPFCSPSLYRLLGIKCSYLARLLWALRFLFAKLREEVILVVHICLGCFPVFYLKAFPAHERQAGGTDSDEAGPTKMKIAPSD